LDYQIGHGTLLGQEKKEGNGMLKWVAAAGIMMALPTAAMAQDAEAGKKAFAKACGVCHAVGPGAKTKVGPELNGVVGRKAGSIEGYTYSPVVKSWGITWDSANLHEWITDAQKMRPGTKMAVKVSDEIARDDIIAYLETFNADGTSK
jgi:cytochrome c